MFEVCMQTQDTTCMGGMAHILGHAIFNLQAEQDWPFNYQNYNQINWKFWSGLHYDSGYPSNTLDVDDSLDPFGALAKLKANNTKKVIFNSKFSVLPVWPDHNWA